MCARFRDPAAQNYAIGDFAKKAGVSTHFLKFYEEKGILHPRVQENGYRYYDIRDASLVLECFRMKNMGLSVRQIEKGINDCTEQEVAEMLQQRENVLQSQLHEQQMHLLGLQNLRVALRLCEQGEWSVRTVPDVWYLPHTIGKEFVQDSRIYDQLPQWLDWMPVVTSAQIARGNDAHAWGWSRWRPRCWALRRRNRPSCCIWAVCWKFIAPGRSRQSMAPRRAYTNTVWSAPGR